MPPSEREVANAEHLTEGACATLEFLRTLFCTRSPSTAIAVPFPLGGRLRLTAPIRLLPGGRGFEEVYKRERQRPESVLHKRRTKTPLLRTKKGSALFALPSEGSNPICWGSFGGARGDFFKSPLEKSRPFPRPLTHFTREEREADLASL